MGELPFKGANWWHYWDSEDVASTTTELILFQSPKSGSKSMMYTNMTQAGQLPGDQKFSVFGISFYIAPAVTLADMKLMLADMYLIFSVSQKSQFESPIFALPGGGGAAGTASDTTASTLTAMITNGVPSPRDIYKFRYPIQIPASEAFDVTVRVRAAMSGLGATTRVFVGLHGILQRGVN
jgi:hypothetical protein